MTEPAWTLDGDKLESEKPFIGRVDGSLFLFFFSFFFFYFFSE
jgi:hypothetical protein